ncbi:MAG: hypothetical protein AAF567_24535 [Actinomycetota bacterium]
MAARLADSEDVIDAWVAAEPSDARRASMLHAVIAALENFDDLVAHSPIPGRSPLTRRIIVTEARLLIDVHLGLPMKVMRITQIHDSL